MAKILVAEDDHHVSDLVKVCLEHERYLVEVVDTGANAISHLRIYPYDLVILDWMLPDMTGVEVCRQFRAHGGSAVVLMMTAKGSVDNKAEGLDAGCDDYIVKPVHPTELLARVRALLRRPKAVLPKVLSLAALELNSQTHEVKLHGQGIHLTPKEYAILELLMKHPNQSFTMEAILDRLWGADDGASIDAVRTHMKTLRRKLDESDQATGQKSKDSVIKTKRGLGYSICSE